MIQIAEQPDQAACAPCGRPLVWLWSARRQAWVAFVSTDDPLVIRVHRCRHSQDAPTWRDLQRVPGPHQAGINAAGRGRVVAAIQDRTEGEAE